MNDSLVNSFFSISFPLPAYVPISYRQKTKLRVIYSENKTYKASMSILAAAY